MDVRKATVCTECRSVASKAEGAPPSLPGSRALCCPGSDCERRPAECDCQTVDAAKAEKAAAELEGGAAFSMPSLLVAMGIALAVLLLVSLVAGHRT